MEVIIIGSGLAGLSAAIRCAQNNVKSIIVSAQPSYCAQSVLAAGGINAVINGKEKNDTIEMHAADTWNAGGQIADRTAVDRLTQNAPKVIDFLLKSGVTFSLDNHQIAQRYFGGQNRKRTCYSHAGIGKQMMSGLEQKVRFYCSQGLIRIEDHFIFIAPVMNENQVIGAIIADRHDEKLVSLQGPVIAASGGMNQIMGNTTGSIHSDGSVTAALYEVGVKMANLEMIQYHPTTVKSNMKNLLISEAVRGEGGRLFSYRNGEKWYFCEEWYGEKGNLMARDIISRAIYRVLHEKLSDDTENTWLDMTHLGEQLICEKLGEVRTLCLEYLNLDPIKNPIPVVPGVHYFMGGIWVDCEHRTSINGLYAAGECCYQYHGANRLGGNSTLGAIYGGQCAAESACDDLKKDNNMEIFSEEILHNEVIRQNILLQSYEKKEDDSYLQRIEMQKIMQESMGIIRDERTLNKGLDKLSVWMLANTPRKTEETENISPKVQMSTIYRYQSYQLAGLGTEMIKSALSRKESRGAHFRSDFTESMDEYRKPTIVQRV